MAVTSEEFRAALSRFPSGVTVVTTNDTEGVFMGPARPLFAVARNAESGDLCRKHGTTLH